MPKHRITKINKCQGATKDDNNNKLQENTPDGVERGINNLQSGVNCKSVSY